MIKWLVIGTFMAIAWYIQERVNAHDRLALKIFHLLEYEKLYTNMAATYFAENSEDLMMGRKTFQIRAVSHLKDSFSHRQMKGIIRNFGVNRVSVQSRMSKTRDQVKVIAKQVAKSYEAMLHKPDAAIPSRKRRRR